MPLFKKIIIVLLLSLTLSGCISTLVGAVVDTTIEVVKVPFKVGGAIVEGVSGGSNKNKRQDESDEKIEQEEQ